MPMSLSFVPHHHVHHHRHGDHDKDKVVASTSPVTPPPTSNNNNDDRDKKNNNENKHETKPCDGVVPAYPGVPLDPGTGVPINSTQTSIHSQTPEDDSHGRVHGTAITLSEHLVAGGIAATASTVAVQPLDVLRTRLQVYTVPKAQRSMPEVMPRDVIASHVVGRSARPMKGNLLVLLAHLARNEGVAGLYRGLVPTLMSVVPSVSIYFTLYSQGKSLVGVPSSSQTYDGVAQGAVAGVSSCFTSALTNPLWVVKTRIQLNRGHPAPTRPIHTAAPPAAGPKPTPGASMSSFASRWPIGMNWRAPGLVQGFGCVPVMMSSCSPVPGTYWASRQKSAPYPFVHKHPHPNAFARPPTLRMPLPYGWRSFSHGPLASSPVSLSQPGEHILQEGMARTHLPRGTLATLRSIVKHEGMRGLYRGLGASMLTSSQAVLQFPLYEHIKGSVYDGTECLSMHEGQRVAICYLSASSIAASIASICTYPTEVVRSRLQVQGMNHTLPRKYTGLTNAFRTILKEEGWRGMYRGLGTSLVRLIPAQAISFTTYEFILRFIREKSH